MFTEMHCRLSQILKTCFSQLIQDNLEIMDVLHTDIIH